jgi:outer membrane protein assembly factor BamB
VNWQVSLDSKGSAGFAPAVRSDAVYAASPDGAVLSVDPATGRQNWRSGTGKPLSGGIGADANLIAVGTSKAEVLTFDIRGNPKWQAKISSEVAGPPQIAEGLVIVWSLDGSIYAFSTADGARRWVVQRTSPPLTVRRFPGGIVNRGGLFAGTAGGKLLAIDLSTGALGWEGNVTTPKGATELERLADITSLPVLDAREVCAAAFQGRVSCFDISRGTLIWARDFGSLGGLALDNRYLFITDDKGAIQALDKTTGASVWKQDKLATRFPSGPSRRRRRRRVLVPARSQRRPTRRACSHRWQAGAVAADGLRRFSHLAERKQSDQRLREIASRSGRTCCRRSLSSVDPMSESRRCSTD